jgi:hypothetical protein
MKISKNCNNLLDFFIKNNHINHISQNIKTKRFIKSIYENILDAYEYTHNLQQQKEEKNNNFNIKKINNINDIPKPKTFNINAFPEEIMKTINTFSSYVISYTFSLFNENKKRKITIYFITEHEYDKVKINKYINVITMWLYVLNKYSSKKCSETLKIYFYFTSLEKKLPEQNIHDTILDEYNVNTAFTRTCSYNSEIVIFRKEEWFKVFIHECFHNFALDFSDADWFEGDKFILKLFPVNSEVNLFEAYTEFWAEIINALFCSFFLLKDKNDFSLFLSNSEILINFERTYSFFQLVKVLDFMKMTYQDLYLKNAHSQMLRENMYKEKTSVLSYYVIKTILINNYQLFLEWCDVNNISLLQFNSTLSNIIKFCKFIEKHYKAKSMLSGVDQAEHFLLRLKGQKHKNKYLMNNLRMSICELE